MPDIKTESIHDTGLSIVIPAYNAATWLLPTLEKIKVAVERSAIHKVEIIIVNDGSADDTKAEAEKLAEQSPLDTTVLSHPNQGRFITRKRGVEAARYATILFVDTRVWIGEQSIRFIADQQQTYPNRHIWNGHINVAKRGNIIARFGDAITYIGWRRYFKNPRLVSYGLEDFDHYPKGTGLFLAPRQKLIEAMEWFEGTTKDVRNSSDDTLLIRHLAELDNIWLSPNFSGTYFARTRLNDFVRHTFYRGQYFVDGFLRHGNRFYYPLVFFLVASLALLAACIILPSLINPVLVGAGIVWMVELIVAITLRLNIKDAVSLFVLSPLFFFAYALGIWTAVIKRILPKAG